MKKKTKKQFIEWIEEQVKYYKPFLGLELQRVAIEEDKDTEYLGIKFVYPYLDPTIIFSEDAFKDFQDGKIPKDRILHELCHALTDPLYAKSVGRFVSKDEIQDERERLTDTITVIIRNLIK